MLDIEKMIREAMVEQNKPKLEAYRSIKNEIIKFRTAKNAKEYNDAAELQLLKKMVSMRNESIELYKQGNRQDLVDKEEAELSYIKELLPAEVTQTDIEHKVEEWKKENQCESGIPRNRMGEVIKYVKAKLPMADGKLTSDIVKAYLI